jgi:hypothetical protein
MKKLLCMAVLLATSGCATSGPGAMQAAVCPTIKTYSPQQALVYLPPIDALPKPSHDLFVDLAATRTTAKPFCGKPHD